MSSLFNPDVVSHLPIVVAIVVLGYMLIKTILVGYESILKKFGDIVTNALDSHKTEEITWRAALEKDLRELREDIRELHRRIDEVLKARKEKP